MPFFYAKLLVNEGLSLPPRTGQAKPPHTLPNIATNIETGFIEKRMKGTDRTNRISKEIT